MSQYLAFDLGAESGRAILGTLSDSRLELEELHRFPNIPVRLPQGLYWDTLRLWHEILQGLAIACRRRQVQLNGIGVDTWGVDFALLGRDGSLVDNPRHYRDPRNRGMIERVTEVVPRQEIFRQTGIQFMQLNTLCQLYAMKLAGAPALEVATRLLFMPDLFNYWLSGAGCAEQTIASTSQFYNPTERRWATELLERLGLPVHILPEIVPAGTRLGEVTRVVVEETGVRPGTPVYATACHDTASAVAAVPARGQDWCYISSGTWSLMGVELDQPLINDESLRLNMTNEVGVAGKIRFLKNIAGLWPLQECRRAWALNGHEYSYGDLAELAAEARPFVAVLDPDQFLEPGRMPEKIAAYCQQTGQPVPSEPAEMTRVILESLALRYRQVLESLERLLGRSISVIHIVGGGSRNRLLNQFAADATGKTVVAGPSEATAAGNILVQAIGAGELPDLDAARSVVRESFELQVFEPKDRSGWDSAYEKFCRLRGEV